MKKKSLHEFILQNEYSQILNEIMSLEPRFPLVSNKYIKAEKLIEDLQPESCYVIMSSWNKATPKCIMQSFPTI